VMDVERCRWLAAGVRTFHDVSVRKIIIDYFLIRWKRF
jgi:hypothetical protein